MAETSCNQLLLIHSAPCKLIKINSPEMTVTHLRSCLQGESVRWLQGCWTASCTCHPLPLLHGQKPPGTGHAYRHTHRELHSHTYVHRHTHRELHSHMYVHRHTHRKLHSHTYVHRHTHKHAYICRHKHNSTMNGVGASQLVQA